MQYCGEEWDSLLKDRFAPSEEWISEDRNIIDEICLVKDRSKIFPVSEEEAEIVSVVYDVFEKADLKTIIAKNQREELVEAIQFLLRVPEIWQSHEFACWAIIAFGKAKGKKEFDFKQDMKGFMDCYKRIDLFYRDWRSRNWRQCQGV